MIQDPNFWFLIAFFLFIAGAGKPGYHWITTALDARAKRIEVNLQKALQEKEKAQDILTKAQKKHSQLEQQMATLEVQGHKEVEKIKQDSKDELKHFYKVEDDIFQDYIVIQTHEAKKGVYYAAVDEALKETEKQLKAEIGPEDQELLVDKTLKKLTLS